jgi:hypothetical protein
MKTLGVSYGKEVLHLLQVLPWFSKVGHPQVVNGLPQPSIVGGATSPNNILGSEHERNDVAPR